MQLIMLINVTRTIFLNWQITFKLNAVNWSVPIRQLENCLWYLFNSSQLIYVGSIQHYKSTLWSIGNNSWKYDANQLINLIMYLQLIIKKLVVPVETIRLLRQLCTVTTTISGKNYLARNENILQTNNVPQKVSVRPLRCRLNQLRAPHMLW